MIVWLIVDSDEAHVDAFLETIVEHLAAAQLHGFKIKKEKKEKSEKGRTLKKKKKRKKKKEREREKKK